MAVIAPAEAADIFVTTTSDGIANDGNCTLREAIRAANTDAAVDTCRAGQAAVIDVIVLTESAAPYRLTVAGADDASGDLDVYSALDITGAPSTIDAGGLGDRVLELRAGAAVKLLQVDLRGGDAGAFPGGGVYAGAAARLLMFGGSVRGNRAAFGAGIAATSGAQVTLHDSDVSNNAAAHGIMTSSATLVMVDSTVADNEGAGVTASSSTVTVLSSTISGNTATGLHVGGTTALVVRNATISGNGRLDLARGGGLLVQSPATASLYYTTVADNSAMTGGGVHVTSTLTMKGSILGSNRAAISHPDCYTESATMMSLGHNLVHREDCSFQPTSTDRVGSDPELDALADWGGPTRTRRLLPGSPALDLGDANNFPPFDQRGEGRPRHGDSDAVAWVDIGAHENGNTIVVNTANDFGVNDGKCDLRDAIRAANGDVAVDGCRAGFDRDLIWIDAAVAFVGLGVAGIDGQAVLGDLDVLRDVDVAGLPGRHAVVDGGSIEGVFEAHAPARLRLSHLDVTRTSLFGAGGAGLRIAPGAGATLFDVAVAGHTAAGFGGGGARVEGELQGEDVWFHDNATNQHGGAIAVEGAGALLELRRARVTDNLSAQGNGGGIAVLSGRARLFDSTISLNRATGGGGGIHNLGTVELVNATIAFNRADSDGVGGGGGGGVDAAAGTTRLWNSLVAENLAASGADCSGTLLSKGYNLLGDPSCSWVAAIGDQLGVEAALAPPLAGLYPTLEGSPARDAGSPETTGSLGSSCSRRDGFGILRPVDGGSARRCDIGAVESVGSGSFDVDGDGYVGALTDGTLILRFLFGFVDDALIRGAIGEGATRVSSAAVVAYLTAIQGYLDVDGDGSAKPLSDGVLIVRYLFGLNAGALISGPLA